MATLKLTKRINRIQTALQQPLSQWLLILRLVVVVLPAVERELWHWKYRLKDCPSSFLREQALQSIKNKRFHCQGGAAYTLFNQTAGGDLLSFIVAFQTISDYLDNLCDRLPESSGKTGLEVAETEEQNIRNDICREQGFRKLHMALQRALEPDGGSTDDFYHYYPHRQDGGYLQCLVHQCQKSLARQANHNQVLDQARFLTNLYCDLQSLKHLSLQQREKALKDWFQYHHNQYHYLYWYEFAAAAGSTLGVFALMAAASREHSMEEISDLSRLYFPWICGLHILLDYYIDQAEDCREGNLNFVFFYKNKEHRLRRMQFFIRQALKHCESIARPLFHKIIIKGLLALYLSDPKIKEQGLEAEAQQLLATTGEQDTFVLFHTCHLLRRCGML